MSSKFSFNFIRPSANFVYECSARIWNRFDEDIEVAYVASEAPLDENEVLDAWKAKIHSNAVADKFSITLGGNQ
jgi:hypothetical protein